MFVPPPESSLCSALRAAPASDQASIESRMAHTIHELLLNDTAVTDRTLLEKGFTQSEIDTSIGGANKLVRRMWPALAREADLVQ